MDTALILLLPLVGGYIFASRWLITSYSVAREDGHRLYFRAAFYGAFTFAVALLLRFILLGYSESYVDVELSITSYLRHFLKTPTDSGQVDTLLISIYALIVGSALWVPLNQIFFRPLSIRRLILNWAVEDDDFEKLIQSAAQRSMPVCVTMDNRKVYVGFVSVTMNPKRERKALTILPLMSGSRDSESGKIVFTTFYNKIYDELDGHFPHLVLKDFELVLPTDRINSSNLFDLGVYAAFQKHAVKRKKGKVKAHVAPISKA